MEVKKSLVPKVKNAFCRLAVRSLVRILSPDSFMELKKWHYYRLIKSFLVQQEPDLKIVRHLVNRGDHVIDLGANIGVYTKFLSEWVGDNGLVFSVEPIPSTFEILVSNIRRLHLENVQPVNCAISDSVSTVTMKIPQDAHGIENHYYARVVETSPNGRDQGIHVTSKTIDSLLSRTGHGVSFFKIDTEGHELPCIRGAMETIARWKPAMLIETHSNVDDRDSSAVVLVDMLREYGYDIWIFDGQNLKQRRVGHGGANSFFLRSEHLNVLRNRGVLGCHNA